jgi:hypothetical protein
MKRTPGPNAPGSADRNHDNENPTRTGIKKRELTSFIRLVDVKVAFAIRALFSH